jgi:hypothetical protein
MRRSRPERSSWVASVASGLVGALVLTSIHESARRAVTHPPRMDTLGRRVVSNVLDATGQDARPRGTLQKIALAGDIVANTMYYAAIAREHGRARWQRAIALGTAAGMGAVALPPFLGLGRAPNSQYASTRLMTTAWYLAGALATAAAATVLAPPTRAAAA